MNEKVNIAELLKDCPDGMELDCTMFEKPVKYIGLTNSGTYVITIKTSLGKEFYLTKDGRLHDTDDAKCIIFPKGKTTWDGFVPPCEFKDGEFLAYHSTVGTTIFIHRNKKDERTYKTSFYVGLNGRGKLLVYDKYTLVALNGDADTCLATGEEKEKLLQAIKDNGYIWNPETKTLKKLSGLKFKVGDRVRQMNSNRHHIIKDIEFDRYVLNNNQFIRFVDEYRYEITEPKFNIGDKIRNFIVNLGYIYTVLNVETSGYTIKKNNEFVNSYISFDEAKNWELVPKKFDITTLKPFDRVLVRGDVGQKWTHDFFGFMDKDKGHPFVCVGNYVIQCIPYECNEHLLGTTDDCDEYYKIWNN